MTRYPCELCGYLYSNRLSAEQCEEADAAEEQSERRRTNQTARRGME